ncbi:MAG: hypothetical protein SAK29_37485 [Scytonema sp. PMC 1069.18]|nr:hypothetical protein [Scytonema sp. PMC 1069.18]MEC4883722.1 hypothetical protein [Scytonema sp. PMC 1070.18]
MYNIITNSDAARTPVSSVRSHTINHPTNTTWTEASKTNPCPVCGKPDWCYISENVEAVVCGRVDAAPMGWKFVKYAKDDRPIYAKENSDTTSAHRYIPIKKPVLKTIPIPQAKLLTLSDLATDRPMAVKFYLSPYNLGYFKSISAQLCAVFEGRSPPRTNVKNIIWCLT